MAPQNKKMNQVGPPASERTRNRKLKQSIDLDAEYEPADQEKQLQQMVDHRQAFIVEMLGFLNVTSATFYVAFLVVSIVVLGSNFYVATTFSLGAIEVLVVSAVVTFIPNRLAYIGSTMKESIGLAFSFLSFRLTGFRKKPYLALTAMYFLMFLLQFTIWFRPLFLYLEKRGIAPFYAGKSTCIATPPTGINSADRGTSYPFNPEGSFTFQSQFNPNIFYGSCVMFTKWAETTGVDIYGYERNDQGVLQCDSPLTNGFIFNLVNSQGTTCSYDNFKVNKAFGVEANENVDLDTLTAIPNVPCPTTTDSPVLVNGVYVNGQATLICPSCLRYFRDQMGTRNNLWPPGYEHCPYDPLDANGEPNVPPTTPFWCAFCPGGNGLSPPWFWLHNERISIKDMDTAFWMQTAIWILCLLKYGAMNFYMPRQVAIFEEEHGLAKKGKEN